MELSTIPLVKRTFASDTSINLRESDNIKKAVSKILDASAKQSDGHTHYLLVLSGIKDANDYRFCKCVCQERGVVRFFSFLSYLTQRMDLTEVKVRSHENQIEVF